MDTGTLQRIAGAPCCSGRGLHGSVHRPCIRSAPAAVPRCGRRTQQRYRTLCKAAEDDDQQEQQPAAQASDAQPAAADTQPAKTKGKGKKTGKTVSLTVRRTQEEAEELAEQFTLDDFNPVAIGRKSRQVFDDVWAQFARLSSGPSRSSGLTDFDYQSPAEEFSSPQATNTTVLVVGATGRVGRILVRKLLLRGYKVRALVRGRDTAALEAIPQSVTVIRGDIGDYDACLQAMQGVDKVITTVTARSDLTVDVKRVEEEGIKNLVRAYMDLLNKQARKEHANKISRIAKVPVVDFKQEAARNAWSITQLGVPRDSNSGGLSRRAQRTIDVANFEKNEWRDAMIFSGSVYSRGGRAEAGGPVAIPEGNSLAGTEGLVMRLGADGNPYTLVLTTADGHKYSTRISTKAGFMTARLPWGVFRPEETNAADAPESLDPAAVTDIAFRYDRSRSQAVVITRDEQPAPNDFRLELDWVKSLPGGTEADFVMVSCVGVGLVGESRKKMVTAKRRGEDILRASGLGYTVVRPGPLAEEPGGYKALVFDQGNRIAQAISCADVADVAVKALHDGAARNKTFEVCSEVAADAGQAAYELVAHLPDRSNNYLTPALASLQRNT